MNWEQEQQCGPRFSSSTKHSGWDLLGAQGMLSFKQIFFLAEYHLLLDAPLQKAKHKVAPNGAG